MMNERLTRLKDSMGVQWNALARMLDISVPMLGFIRNGTRRPSPKVLAAIELLESQGTCNATTATTVDWRQRALAAESRALVAEKKLQLARDALDCFAKGFDKLRDALG